MYDFKGQKYVTSGVWDRIPPDIRKTMFNGIEMMRLKTDNQLDYLQIFRLETFGQDGIFVLNIKHEQEVPEAEIHYVLTVRKEINEKVYVIDDGEHVTMLLAEEY